MAGASTPLLLVTANVGSIFEDPSVMLKIWTEEFLNTVSRLEPKFVALHCQEVGGKNYEESMKHVEYFVKLLMNSDELRLFDKVRVYLDEDYSSAENFTALGNFYFIHENISDVMIWDFKELCFVAIEGKEVFAGNIEDISTKEKSKFPQDFFPECKWSRKGFMRTRWNLNGTVFDLVNIHLFHDASNFVAMETCPSVYSQTRQKALEYTLDRFHNDVYGPAPFFLFGDFNFRTDTQGVIKKLCEGLNQVKVNNGKNCKLQYKDSESQVVLTLGKKEFSHLKHQSVFIDDLWLKAYDKEMEGFCGQLFEFPIKFPPSYPFVEDSSVSCDYMPTRCPAWCDRVLLSQTAKPLLSLDDDNDIEYGLIGKDSCMGDHKPVFLKMRVWSGQGRLSCCETWLMHAPQAHSIPKVPTTIDETDDSSSGSDVTFDVGDIGSDEVGVLCDEVKVITGGGRLLSESSDVQYNNSTMVRSNTDTDGKRPLTERFIVKRVHSASIVEVKVGVLKQGSCKDYWRTRSVSVSGGGGRSPSWRQCSRIRLISKEDLKKSLPRLQSHHSSSDEDWFEEIDKSSAKSKDPPVTLETSDRKSVKGRHCFTFRTRRKVRRRLSKSDTKRKCCTVS